MDQYVNQASRWVERMSTTEWVMVFGVVLLVGLWCLRGFGSRTSY